jgi:hypothetical protein
MKENIMEDVNNIIESMSDEELKAFNMHRGEDGKAYSNWLGNIKDAEKLGIIIRKNK